MGFLGIVVSFLMRQCLSIAITEMVVPVNNKAISNESLICPADYLTPESLINTQNVWFIFAWFGLLLFFFHTNIIKYLLLQSAKKYNWSQEEQGWVLSAFFVGYLVSHIPGGLLAQRFGGKWTLGLGILIVTISNVVTPQALKHGLFINYDNCLSFYGRICWALYNFDDKNSKALFRRR